MSLREKKGRECVEVIGRGIKGDKMDNVGYE